MNRITVRDLRQRWPVAERLLETERELLITRDGQPIARLVRLTTTKVKRRRFDLQKHDQWQHRVFGTGAATGWVENAMDQGRRDRAAGG